MNGANVMGGSPSGTDMPGALAVEAAGDVDAALGRDLVYVCERELGDGSIDIHDNVENTFVENSFAEEDVVGRAAIESEKGGYRCVCSSSFSSVHSTLECSDNACHAKYGCGRSTDRTNVSKMPAAAEL